MPLEESQSSAQSNPKKKPELRKKVMPDILDSGKVCMHPMIGFKPDKSQSLAIGLAGTDINWDIEYEETNCSPQKLPQYKLSADGWAGLKPLATQQQKGVHNFEEGVKQFQQEDREAVGTGGSENTSTINPVRHTKVKQGANMMRKIHNSMFVQRQFKDEGKIFAEFETYLRSLDQIRESRAEDRDDDGNQSSSSSIDVSPTLGDSRVVEIDECSPSRNYRLQTDSLQNRDSGQPLQFSNSSGSQLPLLSMSSKARLDLQGGIAMQNGGGSGRLNPHHQHIMEDSQNMSYRKVQNFMQVVTDSIIEFDEDFCQPNLALPSYQGRGSDLGSSHNQRIGREGEEEDEEQHLPSHSLGIGLMEPEEEVASKSQDINMDDPEASSHMGGNVVAEETICRTESQQFREELLRFAQSDNLIARTESVDESSLSAFSQKMALKMILNKKQQVIIEESASREDGDL
ncbi:hypothetical protein FGO68_gene7493 [Halteria grandinella]|uniref:Uncharacterized protein n=1 Tax=Halteria grandinella TaxID=5974 RepID=A0A8J8T4U9_HALGN|nr:hypothetical protein FGO68_gene7493 [Halteria grandinella]